VDVALLSDTHIPARADAIPGAFRDRIAAADHVVHAGDFETEDVLADVRDLASGLTAVYGNADPVDTGLPAVDSVTLDGVTFVVTHGMANHVKAAVYDHGMVLSEEDWLDAIADTARARTRAWEGDTSVVGVGGHTHQVVDETHGGFRVLNPGTATGAAPADEASMMTAEVADGDVSVTVHEGE
jgi:putative phosphoesterase